MEETQLSYHWEIIQSKSVPLFASELQSRKRLTLFIHKIPMGSHRNPSPKWKTFQYMKDILNGKKGGI